MTISERLRQLVSALPSDASAVTFTRHDLVALLDREAEPASAVPSRDLSVEEVAAEVQRSTSTVRTWLIAGELKGYKLQGKAWRVPRAALRKFLDHQGEPAEPPLDDAEKVDISAWRKLRGVK